MNSDTHSQKAATRAGRWIKTLEGYRAFHPNPLPPRIEWTQPLAVALANASTLVGKLAGEGKRLPNPHVLIRPFVRREAVYSSRIEGTQSTHGERAAERLLGKGMKLLGLKEADLKDLPLGCSEKVALAWWLRKHTTVSLRWVADRLKMGHYSRVSQAVSRSGRKPGKHLAQLCRQLGREVEHA